MTSTSELTPLERQALDRLLAGHHPLLSQLRGQIAHLEVARREESSAGLVVTFRARTPLPPVGETRTLQILDVYGRVAGLGHDVGFILFVSGGRLERLEGQPLEGNWPANPRLERLFYVSPRIEGGSEMVETPNRDLAWALGTGAATPAGPPPAESPSSLGDTNPALEREATMDQNTKVYLEPDLTQRVPADVLDHKRKSEPAKEAPIRPPERPPEAAAEVLSSRRLIYLVGYNVFLGTLLTLALLYLVPRAPYLADLSHANAGLASGDIRVHLTSTLLLVALAGAAGSLLANLWDLVRQSGASLTFPGRLEIAIYLRPLAGAVQGLLLFFVVHLALAAVTVGTFTLSWVTLPGRMAYVGLSFAAGFGVEEVIAKMRDLTATLFSRGPAER